MAEHIIKKKILENLTQEELIEEIRQRNLAKPMMGVLVVDEKQIQFKIDEIGWVPGVYHVEIHYVKDYDIAAHHARAAAQAKEAAEREHQQASSNNSQPKEGPANA